MQLLTRAWGDPGAAEVPGDELGAWLARYGLVMVRQGTVSDVLRLLEGWTAPAEHPHDREPGLTTITPRLADETGAAGLAGFTHSPLAPHTDRSLHPNPPSVLATLLVEPADGGGQARLADGARVLADLRRSFPPALVEGLRLCTAHAGAVPVITEHDGLARIRLRDDQVARPCSGDRRIVAALRDAISTHTTTVALGPGDGYILHNHRYLHGRSGFTGQRRVIRMQASVTCLHLAWLNRGFRARPS